MGKIVIPKLFGLLLCDDCLFGGLMGTDHSLHYFLGCLLLLLSYSRLPQMFLEMWGQYIWIKRGFTVDQCRLINEYYKLSFIIFTSFLRSILIFNNFHGFTFILIVRWGLLILLEGHEILRNFNMCILKKLQICRISVKSSPN